MQKPSPSALPPFPKLLRNPAIWGLIAANVIPLLGVLYFHWDIGTLILLYWSENIVVGLYTVLKILVVGRFLSVFEAGFFIVHYGMFTAVHGLFVFLLFKIPVPDNLFNYRTANPVEYLQHVIAGLLQFFPHVLHLSFIALVVSHGVSFLLNFLGQGEFRRTTVQKVLFSPYGRIVILHITILLGGFVIMVMGSPFYALLMLVLLKTAIDVVLHWRSHHAVVAGPTK